MLISGVSTWKASANGFRLPDQDAFATARGEAFVATADNASAIYYNPAGITQLAGTIFAAGFFVGQFVQSEGFLSFPGDAIGISFDFDQLPMFDQSLAMAEATAVSWKTSPHCLKGLFVVRIMDSLWDRLETTWKNKSRPCLSQRQVAELVDDEQPWVDIAP